MLHGSLLSEYDGKSDNWCNTPRANTSIPLHEPCSQCQCANNVFPGLCIRPRHQCGLSMYYVVPGKHKYITTAKVTPQTHFTNLVANANMPTMFSHACALSTHADDDSEHWRDKNNYSALYYPSWSWPKGMAQDWNGHTSHNLPTTCDKRTYGWRVVLI